MVNSKKENKKINDNESKNIKLDKNNEIKKKSIKDDEPSWYHYVIVLLFFGTIFAGMYYGYEFFFDNNNNVIQNNSTILYNYPYKVGNVTYNLYFDSSVDDVKNSNFTIEPSKLDILNTIYFTFVFYNYNGTDNGEVSKGSTKMTSFLKTVYHFQFSEDSFKMYNETSCSDSTIRDKVITFYPYSDKNGVFYNETNGCMEFLVSNPKDMVNLVDKFIYEMVNEDTNIK